MKRKEDPKSDAITYKAPDYQPLGKPGGGLLEE